MADTQTYYDSTLTGPELDAALQKLPQVDAAVEQSARNQVLAQSWAEGGTGQRQGEDLHNARYWCTQAQTIANGCLGWFDTRADLQQVHPTGQKGQWALVGETDTIWIWDAAKAAWEDSGAQVDLSPYYTARQTRSITPFLYKATFLLDGWSGSGPYTQTAALQPVDGGPAVTAGSISVTAGIDNALPQATREILRGAAAVINRGGCTLGAGTVTVSAEEQPDADAEVYFWVRESGA